MAVWVGYHGCLRWIEFLPCIFSLKKLQDICYPDVDDQRWFANLEATHWLDHIKVSLPDGIVKPVEPVCACRRCWVGL